MESSCNNGALLETPDENECHPGSGVTYELWVQSKMTFYVEKSEIYQKWKHQCGNDTEAYNLKKPVCDGLVSQFDATKETCDAEQTNLETAACNEADKIKATCSSYTECYNNAVNALNTAKPSIEAQVKDRKGEWRACMRIECLFDVFSDETGGRGVNVEQIDTCKAKVHDTSHLDIAFPTAPGQ